MSAYTADAHRGGFAAGAASRGRLVARLMLPGFPQRESSSCLNMDDRVRHCGLQRSAKFETYASGHVGAEARELASIDFLTEFFCIFRAQ